MKVTISDRDYKIDESGTYYLCPNCQDHKFFKKHEITTCPKCKAKLKNEIIQFQPTENKRDMFGIWYKIGQKDLRVKNENLISYVSGCGQI